MKKIILTNLILLSLILNSCGKKEEIAQVAVDLIPLKNKVVTGFVEGKERVNIYVQMQGKGEPVFILPGGPGYSFNYLEPFVSQLDSHYQIIYIDPRGCGKSDKLVDLQKYNLDDIVADIESVKSALQIKNFHIIAHETGTLIAQQYVIKNPGHVKKMVLMSSTAQVSDLNAWLNGFRDFMPRAIAGEVKRYERDSMYSGDRFNSQYEALVLQGIKNPNLFTDPTYATMEFSLPERNWDVHNTIWGRGGFFNITGNIANFDTREKLQTVDVEALVLCGQNDYIAPFVMESLVSSIPKADIHVFENSGHFFFIERNQEFIEKVKEFFKK